MAFAPVLLLLQFLSYHENWLTWEHRLALLVDLALLWWLWRKIVASESAGLQTWASSSAFYGAVGATAVALNFVFLIATFPGGWVEKALPTATDRAQLQGSSLPEAQLQGASLSGAQLQGATLRDAQLQGASLKEARLRATDPRCAFLWRSDWAKTWVRQILTRGWDWQRQPWFDFYGVEHGEVPWTEDHYGALRRSLGGANRDEYMSTMRETLRCSAASVSSVPRSSAISPPTPSNARAARKGGRHR